MAHVLGAPETLGQQLDMEVDEPISYDMAVRITSALHMSKGKKNDVADTGPRAVTLANLGAKAYPTTTARTLKITYDRALVGFCCGSKNPI